MDTTKGKKPRVISLATQRRQEETVQPFINTHKRISSGAVKSSLVEDPLSSRDPFNKVNLELGEDYRGRLPKLLQSNIVEVRDFFLREIAPLILACSNGLQDATDILEVALGEKPDTAMLQSKINNTLRLAIDLKIASFISKFAGLSAELDSQLKLVLMSHSLKSNDLIKTLLSEMQPLSDVSRQKESSDTQLPELQASQGRGVDSRARRASPRARGKSRY